MQTLEDRIESCKESFIGQFSEAPLFVAYASGRINIIGEHTDYNQGLSMPCAINRWVTVGISPTSDRRVRIVSMDFKGEMTFDLGESYQPKNSWENYIYGCILLFNDTAPIPSGFQAIISGNVPVGSGVSSSAALEVAFMNALNYFSKAGMDALSLIQLCQQVEHRYLQVKSGLLDQYASQFSVAGKIMVLDFQKLTHRYISADMQEYVWILCDSKVKRALAGSKYSERVEETKTALAIIKAKTNDVNGFRDLEEKHLILIEDPNQRKRIRHYITENKRVVAALKSIDNNDMEAFGKIITASHYSLKNDYEVSCDELDFLVNEALKTYGCIGSRMMGGGFGGCTINLVRKDRATEFSDQIRKAYLKQFHIETEINRYQTVNGSGIVDFKHV